MIIDSQCFANRRDRFLALLGGKAAIIPAAQLVIHHADCEYTFRQNSDFWYLTGFDEPDAIALFLPYRADGEKFVLFVLPKEPGQEIWTGVRSGVEVAINDFGADIAHPLEQFSSLLSYYLQGAEGIFFRIGKNTKIETIVLKVWQEHLDKIQRNGLPPLSLEAPCPLIHKLRLIKEQYELVRLREASRISAEAHEIARMLAKPGMTERQIQAEIEKHFLIEGARGPAYPSIVASGDNACVLHYTKNNSQLCNDELLLIDAGCSLNDYYNGDITRTFPVNGVFTPEQLAIYQIVLSAQEAAISFAIEGQTAEAVHLEALKVLIEGLLDIKLLKGSVESIIEEESYRHLYMHRTGHWLGLDVHDVGAYRLGEQDIELKESMVLTVEPGLYISDRLPVPKGQPEIGDCWKGIGIRIEDNVAVGLNSPEILTSKALKSVEDMQK